MHTNERLSQLKPGINCTTKYYRQLQLERIDLTLRVNNAKVRSKGYTIVQDENSLYVFNNIFIVLGDIYRDRVGA